MQISARLVRQLCMVLGLASVGCSSLLGDFQVGEPGGTDGSTDASGGDVSTGVGDGGPRDATTGDALPTGRCTTNADCVAALGQTTPDACASATCDPTTLKCSFAAKDQDGDGHATAHCVAANASPIALGDDCDDGDPQLYPGHPANCSEGADGGTIVFPGGTPRGACKYGQKSCQSDGTVGACMGAVGPSPNLCDGKDEACTGDPLVGCACQVGTMQSCGPQATGICHPGMQTCQSNGTWGACTGAQQPLPRDCTSSMDNDCDGVPDNTMDAVCQCEPIGGTAACQGHQQDGTGVCHAGSQTCTAAANNTSSAYGACSGSVGPSPEICDGLDNDCNGAVDDGNPGGGGSCNTGKPGVCGPGTYDCSGGGLVCTQNTAATSTPQSQPGPNGSWDWNCDGNITMSPSSLLGMSSDSCTDVNLCDHICAVDRAGSCGSGPALCPGSSANCGQEIVYANCHVSGSSCAVTSGSCQVPRYIQCY